MINNNAWNFDNTYAVGDVLYADTTSTLAKQNIGTAGQVLTVSGGIPTWQTPSAVTPVVPPTTLFYQTDFYSDIPQTTSLGGSTAWVIGNFTTDVNHPGQIFSRAGNAVFTGSIRANLLGTFHLNQVDQVDIYFLAKQTNLSVASPRYKSYKGIGNGNISLASSYGVFFSYTNTEFGGNFAINTKNAASTTSLDSGVLADTNWHFFQIQITGSGTNAEFFIDGVSVGNINTNINTTAANVSWFEDFVIVAGPAQTYSQVDYYAHQFTMVGTRF